MSTCPVQSGEYEGTGIGIGSGDGVDVQLSGADQGPPLSLCIRCSPGVGWALVELSKGFEVSAYASRQVFKGFYKSFRSCGEQIIGKEG